MPMKLSPGCNCSCGCLLIEVPEYNTDITAGVEHEINHNVPVNCTVDFSNLVDKEYFADESNQLTVRVKNTAGTTTHKTFTFQSERDSSNAYPSNTKEFSSVPHLVDRKVGPYAQQGYKRWINAGISGETDDYRCQEALKILSVGDVLYRIKSVSAGTFDKTEGLAVSYLEEYQQIASEGANICEINNIGRGSLFAINKNRYVFTESETTQSFNVYRVHRNSSYPDDTVIKTEMLFDIPFGQEGEYKTWADGDVSKTYNYNNTLDSSKFYGLTLNVDDEGTLTEQNLLDQKLNLSEYLENRVANADVLVLPTTSETGDGYFELETTRVNGLENTSTTVRVYRTGGNSTAVDVVVAVGNTDVTLNFSAGDIYKSFTINHVSHDGETFTAAMHPTNDAIMPYSLGVSLWQNPLEFIMRKSTYEFGNVDTFNPGYDVRKDGGVELWKNKIPFLRTGWTDSSVKFYVESNSDVTLEAYKIYEITHDPNCDVEGDNVDCPPYNRCNVISEYHSQQFDIDIDIGLGAASSYFPAVSYFINDKCRTENIYWSPFLDMTANQGKWIFQVNDHRKLFYSTESTVTDVPVYGDSIYSYGTNCGYIRDETVYSSMPSGCISFDTTVQCHSADCGGDTYADIIVTHTVLPVTEEREFERSYEAFANSAASCHSFHTCEDVDLDTTDGIHEIRVGSTAILADRVDRSETSQANICDDGFAGFFQERTHLKGDRFLTEVEPIDLKNLAVWEWNGYANLEVSGPHSNVSSDYTDDCTYFYVGQEAPYEYDCSDANRDTVQTPSEIATEVSAFLTSGGADYWFNYTNASNPSDDGYYRVVHPSTLTGPFTTADDGTGNTHYNIYEEVGIKIDLSIMFYTSPVSGDRSLSNWQTYFESLFPSQWDLEGNAFYTESTTSGVQTLSRTVLIDNKWITLGTECIGSCELRREAAADPDAVLCQPQNSTGISENPLSGNFRAFKNYIVEQSDTSMPSGYSFSSCSATAADLTVVCIEPNSIYDGPPTGKCWKIIDTAPALTTGTCTSTINYIEVCCDGAVPVSEVVESSYYDLSTLTDWSGEVEFHSQLYTALSYEITLGSIDVNEHAVITANDFGDIVQNPASFEYKYGNGPAYYILDTAKYFFPVKWGDCWTGLDSRTESWDGSVDDIVGPDKIYALRTMASGVGGPYLSSGTATDNGTPQSVAIDFSLSSTVIEKSNFTITSQAYSPLWEKY